MYSIIIQSPVTSSAASTKDHYHSLSLLLRSVIPAICFAILLWKPSRTIISIYVTAHISLLYRSTAYTTTLYNINRALIGAPVLPSTFDTTLHLL